jgi:hypothetical protein
VLLPEDQDIDFNYFDDMDDGSFLPTDSLTVRNHLLEAGVNIDNDNNNDVLLLQQQKNIKSIPYYKSTKTHLNRVIKKGSFKDTISELVKKIHLLRMISTHVLKLYIIQKRKNYPNFDFTQIIDKTFIINLIEVIANLREIVPASTSSVGRCRHPPTRYGEYVSTEKFNYFNTVEKNKEKEDILKFLLDFVVKNNENLTIFHGIDIKNCQNIISVMAEEIVTSYHQNIVANYKSYVNKYVDSFYLNSIEYEIEEIDTSNRLTKAEKTTKKTQTYHKFRLVKSDLVEPDKSKHKSVDPFAISFIQANQRIIFPKDR